MQRDLTKGSIFHNVIYFAIPYLISCFLQTFYGLADLFITGQFNGAATVTAVSVGSQIMHMITVIIVGLAMGTTVTVGMCIGEKNREKASDYIGNSIIIFSVMSIILTILTIVFSGKILILLSTPAQAIAETEKYIIVCFAGIPFITGYNVISSIFRGMGDTKSPLIFVGIAGIVNIIGDYILIGALNMGALGAAVATVSSQACSVIIAVVILLKRGNLVHITMDSLKLKKEYVKKILIIGTPISFQDGLIQVSFLVITAIANSRGVDVAAAVGIVEKIISFLFLVPSAMLSTVSAIAAQNAGAGSHERAKSTLYYGIRICIVYGIITIIVCEPLASVIVSIFVKNEPKVVILGAQYLRTYVFDCLFAGMHFCFSGYFSAYGKSIYSFIHNIISIVLMRIPGAYLASVFFPATLYAMGIAAPAGSLLSVIICMYLYLKILIPDIKSGNVTI
ncbi:MAG: MATE family efflux transporter [Lachnospiraceae bacterium]|nr:MATE family efflux transporter [Lachnospiraceae bacterium]